jgi:hypothetical protein
VHEWCKKELAKLKRKKGKDIMIYSLATVVESLHG